MDTFIGFLLLGAAAAVIIMLVSYVIEAILSFFQPGPKGYIKFQNRRYFDRIPETELRHYFTQKLKGLKFRITSDIPGHLVAVRESHQFPEDMSPFSCKNLPMKMEMQFIQDSRGVEASLLLKYRTWIFCDDGEGDYIRDLSEFILSEQKEGHESPEVISRTSTGRQCMLTAIFSLGGVLAIFHITGLPYEDKFYGCTLHTAGWILVIVSLYFQKSRKLLEAPPYDKQSGSLWYMYALATSAIAFFTASFFLHEKTGRLPVTEILIYGILSYVVGRVSGFIGSINKKVAMAQTAARDPEKLEEAFEELASQIEIESEETPRGDVKINVPLQKSCGAAAFMSVWLCGWVAGEVLVIRELIKNLISMAKTGSLPKGGEIFAFIFMCIWLAGWSVGGFFAWVVWLWNLTARLTIYCDGSYFTIEKRLAWRVKSHSYDLDKIEFFRVEPDPKGINIMGLTPNIFAFEYQGNTVRFGRGVSHPEALAVKKKLEEKRNDF